MLTANARRTLTVVLDEQIIARVLTTHALYEEEADLIAGLEADGELILTGTTNPLYPTAPEAKTWCSVGAFMNAAEKGEV